MYCCNQLKTDQADRRSSTVGLRMVEDKTNR